MKQEGDDFEPLGEVEQSFTPPAAGTIPTLPWTNLSPPHTVEQSLEGDDFEPLGEVEQSLEGDDFEPLGEVEQSILDGWLGVSVPQGCRWIDDADQSCDQPLSQLPSQLRSYCEEHLHRSLTEAGWRRLLASVGRSTEG